MHAACFACPLKTCSSEKPTPTENTREEKKTRKKRERKGAIRRHEVGGGSLCAALDSATALQDDVEPHYGAAALPRCSSTALRYHATGLNYNALTTGHVSLASRSHSLYPRSFTDRTIYWLNGRFDVYPLGRCDWKVLLVNVIDRCD